MSNRVLILSEPSDLHAFSVAKALRAKDVEVFLWKTSDFPSQSRETVVIEESGAVVKLSGPVDSLAMPRFDVVWRRRPCYVIDQEALHPADRAFADFECNIFRRSLFDLLAPDAFWVNPQSSAMAAGRKVVQHAVACKVGLGVPKTIYSNDPGEIRKFISQQGGSVVYKPFRPALWADEETYWAPYTSLLTESDLVEDALLQAVPGIYQALVPKSFEVRVTIMGSRIFGVKLMSQQTVAGRLDWRKAYSELRMESMEIPSSVGSRCLRLMKSFGLVFGCLDFVVTPRGEYVFLEVNEMGQFLFLEHYADIPLLDAFCEFLAQGRTNFEWDERIVSVRYRDICAEAQHEMDLASETHVTPPPAVLDEVGPFPLTSGKRLRML